MVEDWISLEEATSLAQDYIDAYDPERDNVAASIRNWTSEVTNLSVLYLMNKARVQAGVNGRLLWATAMWSAGYSYPQIARSMNRENHTTIVKLLRNRKVRPEITPYLVIARNFGATLGKHRLEWVEKGNPNRKRRFRHTPMDFDTYARDRRRAKLGIIEADLQYKMKAPVVVEKISTLPPIKPPTESDMADLAVAFAREARR